MNNLVRPLFITPLIYQKGNVNAEINTAFIDSLPSYFAPTVLCYKADSSIRSSNVLNINNNILERIYLHLKLRLLGHKTGFLPDTFYYIWYKKALNVADKYIKENKIDYIHSFSFPYTSHLVALELKKKYGIPWIAHFYEPWGDNPYRRYSEKVITSNCAWEDEVVRAADIIIHNSDVICQSWLNRYGNCLSNRLFSLPMSFSFRGQSLSAPFYNSQSKLRIVHIGNFYGMRKAMPFLEALTALLNEKPHFRKKLNIAFIGEMLAEDIDFITKHKLDDIVKIFGRKSEEECVQYYQHSDVFLVIEGENQGLLFFPSKLIQYYYYNRPIIGLTQQESVLWNELTMTGHKVYCPNDFEGIKSCIETALLNYNSLLNYDHDCWTRFEPNNVVEKYIEILNNIFNYAIGSI